MSWDDLGPVEQQDALRLWQPAATAASQIVGAKVAEDADRMWELTNDTVAGDHTRETVVMLAEMSAVLVRAVAGYLNVAPELLLMSFADPASFEKEE